jgi:hydrogenase expression/formation protein HypC
LTCPRGHTTIAVRYGEDRAGGDGARGLFGDRKIRPVARAGHLGEPLMCLAIPGQVLEIVDEHNRLAKVEVAGVRRTVNVGLLDGNGNGAKPGEWVLIHVGFAMSKVDEDEAHATLRLLQEMGDAYEQELEDLKTSVIE